MKQRKKSDPIYSKDYYRMEKLVQDKRFQERVRELRAEYAKLGHLALVRLAQNGNVRAKQELTRLLSYTIEAWITDSPRVSKWQWYSDRIPEQIERCIRCYRYTGSFIGYLFRTLEYAGRGLRPVFISSLDECFRDTEKRKIDNVVKDPETQEIRMFVR